MANKLYAMELLTEEVAKDVAANPQEWMRFLNTASRLYRYTFPEQLLIYAQRPGATAVASMEIWNQKMYRWIKKGSKGIALIDNTSGPKTKLRYVFDMQDTYKVKNLGRLRSRSSIWAEIRSYGILIQKENNWWQIICRSGWHWKQQRED